MKTSIIFHLTPGEAIGISFACLFVGIYIGSLFCRQITGAAKEQPDEDEHD